jgi:hypothetical protein
MIRSQGLPKLNNPLKSDSRFAGLSRVNLPNFYSFATLRAMINPKILIL